MKKILLIASGIAGALYFVAQAYAAPAIVNQCSTVAGGSTGAIHCSLGTVTTGDTIVVMVAGTASSTATITDKGGNSYTQATVVTSTLGMQRTFYASNVTGASSFNVTSTWGVASTTSGYLAAFEWSGLMISNPLDVTSSNFSASQPTGVFTSGTSTTSAAGDVLMGEANCNDSPGVVTQGTGFLLLATSSSQCNISEATTTGAAAPWSARFSISSNGDKVQASMVTFKAATASPIPTADVTISDAVTIRNSVTIR